MRDGPTLPDWHDIKELLEECNIPADEQSETLNSSAYTEEKEHIKFEGQKERSKYSEVFPVINSIIDVLRSLGAELVQDREQIREIATRLQLIETRLNNIETHLSIHLEGEGSQPPKAIDEEDKKYTSLTDSPMNRLYQSVLQLRQQIQALRKNK